MNANNLLFGVLLTVIRFQFLEAHKGVDLIKLTPREPHYTKTVVLDLDETLVFAYDSDECDGKESFPIKIGDLEHSESFCVHLRDGVVETLKHLEEGTPGGDRWELIIWTAGSNDYADKIVEYLRKQGIEIAHAIGRETSMGEVKEGEKDQTEKGTIKDIRRLINADSGTDPNPRTLEKMVIVDNRPENCYPGENTIGIDSWYGFHEKSHRQLMYDLRWEEWDDLERSETGSIFGPDEGKAMKQLKVELDELAGKEITLERLNDKLQGQGRAGSGPMIYYREQPIMMSKQVEMVRKAGRDREYTNTLILDLYRDFLSFEDGRHCYGQRNCWETEYDQTARFRDDAINTLKALQQVAPDGERWELIDWTDASQPLAESLKAFLSEQGIEIVHILATHEWDSAAYHFEKNWKVRSVSLFVSETRPVDSMVIAHKDPIPYWNCFPPETSVLGTLYRYLYRQIDTVREAGRHKRYSKTLILNLEQDFVYIDKDKDCGKGKENCILAHAVQFRDDAISTLKSLQEGWQQWELIIWTDLHREFAEGIAEMLRQKGVDIAYVLAGRDWDNVGLYFYQSEKDIERLASEEGRPLDSMLIVHNHPSNCWPRENAVGIRSWYGRDMSAPDKKEFYWLEKTLDVDVLGQTRFIDKSLKWPTLGSDDAMKQLKCVLDGLSRESIGVKTLSKVIFSELATTELVREKEQMVYFEHGDRSRRIRSSTGWRPLGGRL